MPGRRTQSCACLYPPPPDIKQPRQCGGLAAFRPWHPFFAQSNRQLIGEHAPRPTQHNAAAGAGRFIQRPLLASALPPHNTATPPTLPLRPCIHPRTFIPAPQRHSYAARMDSGTSGGVVSFPSSGGLNNEAAAAAAAAGAAAGAAGGLRRSFSLSAIGQGGGQ